MNKTKDVKIIFNTLIQRMWKNNINDETIDNPLYLISDIIPYINKQKKIDKFYDLKGNKFCFLESSTIKIVDDNNTLINGFFKSAKSEFRPDLINKTNGSERKNPKAITEGDIEKTHFVIKIDKTNKEVYLFLESNFHGVNANNIINYFTTFCKKYLDSIDKPKNFTIINMIIPGNEFLTELERLSRTKLAEIYFDKQLLGTKALNFSERTIPLKKEIKLVASASLNESISEFAVDVFNLLNARKGGVSKIRVYGTDNNDNDVILDTNFMSKLEFITVDLDQETGEVNSSQLFTGLSKIASTF